MTDTSQDTKEFIERMGLITQAEGLPRIAGRIMGFMVIYGGIQWICSTSYTTSRLGGAS